MVKSKFQTYLSKIDKIKPEKFLVRIAHKLSLYLYCSYYLNGLKITGFIGESVEMRERETISYQKYKVNT